VELAPEPIMSDIPRLAESLGSIPDGFLLIGRRHLRSNNSWMHNLPALAGGTNRCTLQIHPDDAARLGVTDTAVITGPAGKLEVPVEITDAIRPGVVSLPHGWGHDAPGTRMTVAAAAPGVNVNSLLDSSLLEPLSGTSVLNGVPVEVMAAG
jgi:anaerobic selenocysteine-containing dehydrogenase